MKQEKPKKWMRYLIFAALILPSLVLFMNENGEYEVGGISINSLFVVILAAISLFLFYEHFIDKAQVKTKPANIGPGADTRGQGFSGQEEYPKPFSPVKDYRDKPPFG